LDSVLEKNYNLVIQLVNYKKEPIKNVSVKIFKLEKESITLKQWAENLKNGLPFQRLILSINTDINGNLTAELVEGVYEIKVEKCSLSKVCELTQNDKVLFIDPKKRWWQ